MLAKKLKIEENNYTVQFFYCVVYKDDLLYINF